MKNSSKQVWLITGCSTGFGRELAKLILENDWNVVITARNTDQVKDIAEGYGEQALILQLDVTDKNQVKSAITKAEETFGKIDVLVNNAGFGYFSSIEEGEDEKIRAQFETNFFGIVNMVQAMLPGLRKNGKGTIVNVSSIGGLIGFVATGYYHATKFAVEGFSESLAQEISPLGIKVLLVEPGPFRTDWSGRSSNSTEVHIEDYQQTVGKRIEAYKDAKGKQKGDPIRAGKAIIEAVEAGVPYPRLVLGKIALDAAHAKVKALNDDFLAWNDLSLGADFPDPEE